MKKPWAQRLGDFLAGKGFYIVLFLCLAAIGISGYYLFSSLGSVSRELSAQHEPVSSVPDGEAREASGTAPVPSDLPVSPRPSSSQIPDAPEKPVQSPAVQPSPSPSPSPSAAPSPSPSPAATPHSLPTSAVVSYSWPLYGAVVGDFSLEALAYDETMGDWRTHCGLDIAADVGTQVRTVAPGTVIAVYDDDLLGTCVEIEHTDGITSCYCNLGELPAVAVGDKVGTGQVIGAVGTTALAESARVSHLHLEMRQGDTAVDPQKYLPTLD